LRLDFTNYSAEIGGDSVSIFLNGRRYAVLKAASMLDTPESEDAGGALSGPEIVRGDGWVDATWRGSSELWSEKTFHWRFSDGIIEYKAGFTGEHAIKALRYFDGGKVGGSYCDFSRFLNPDCALLDQRHYLSIQYGCIDASSGQMSDYARDGLANCHWIFTPPPFCYSLGFSDGPWIGAGIAPERGQYSFTRFEYSPSPWDFRFRLTYEGMTRSGGAWESPTFLFCPAESDYAALEAYCGVLRERGFVNENRHIRADWWSKPIFCGWGEQNVTAAREGGGGSTYAAQVYYDRFLAIIREKRLKPGTMVIDDKWQKHYGTFEVDTTKWPDLRGWIDERHAEGLRVLLWFGAWNPEGLPEDETIRNADGVVCADPTSPAYQERIREYMHRMLSSDAGCYNADGIKYDWTNGIPVTEGYSVHGDAWGIELLKSLTQQVYDAGKAAKPDALIITHTANPYFAECADMIRLNDIFIGCREVASMMTHRQKIARIACPHALIDCDNSSAPNHTEWLEFTRMQPELGVPSLYFLTGFDGSSERITDDDWEILAPIWR